MGKESCINALPSEYIREVESEAARFKKKYTDKGRERLVLLVGGAGYIGSVLTEYLLSSGYKVRCMDALLYRNEKCVYPFVGNPDYQFIKGDFADRHAMETCLQGATDVVILGGLVGDPITKKYPEESARINDDGIKNLIDMLDGRGVNKVILISTCSNYGLVEGDVLADEEFELKPLSLYAKSKVVVEKELLSKKRDVDYVATVLRFATAFGLSNRMRFDLTVSEFTRDIFLGNDLLVYDANTWRPYCHVRDFSILIKRVLEAPVSRVDFEVFNAGGDANNYTKQMIVNAILEEIPNAKVSYKEHGSDPRNYKVGFSKVRRRLYFEPSFTVVDGIKELVRTMKGGIFANVDADKPFYGNYEIEYR